VTTAPPFKARTYQPKDLEDCVALFDTMASDFRLPHEKKDLVRFLTGLPHTGLAVVLEDEMGRLMACGGLLFKSSEEASLCWGMVDPGWQGRGLGKALRLLRLSMVSDMPDIHRVSVTVSQHDEGFYRGLGFKPREVLPGGYAPGLDKHILFLEMDDAVRREVAKECAEMELCILKSPTQ
jgi:ribosomal protein S18 acetylase RimI-like enzyme